MGKQKFMDIERAFQRQISIYIYVYWVAKKVSTGFLDRWL